MPSHKSAEKRVRTSERDRKRNMSVKSAVRSAVRRFREGVRSSEAPELLRGAHSVLDNAARKGVVHRKTADRRKSRLARALNRLGKKEPAA